MILDDNARNFIYILWNFCACRKIPRDLTEASLSGAGLSIIAALSMIFLFGMVSLDLLVLTILWRCSSFILSLILINAQFVTISKNECYFDFASFILQELNNYLAVSTSTSVIVDRSADGDFLRLDFNIRYIILNFVSQYKSYSFNILTG